MKDKKLALRSEVRLEDTWDLTQIFKTEAEFEQMLKDLEGDILEELKSYKGRLIESADTLYNFLKTNEKFTKMVYKVYMYAHLSHDVDVADTKNAANYARVNQVLAKTDAVLSFVDPELMKLTEETLEKFYVDKKELELYRHHFKVLLRHKDHTLSEQEEYIIAKFAPIKSAANMIFSKLTDADIVFPEIEDEKGNKHQLSEGLYRVYMESKDRTLRKNAFETLLNTYHSYRNTLAESLFTQIKGDNLTAELRKFSSAREAALYNNQIPESVYDSLIEEVNNGLDAMHEYMAYRKSELGVDELHFYDLSVPLVEDLDDVSFTFEEAKELVLEALKPLGEDYCKIVKKAFDERWIDIPENKGKRTGAYSSGAQGMPAYILLNWNGTLDAVYTLIHELGHSLHSWHTWTNQEPVYAGYGIFLAEIASTFNENLLTAYLLKKYENDPKMHKYLLVNYLNGVKGTVYRQTMFAEFELKTHEAAANNVALTADALDDIYGELSYKYHGEAVERDAYPRYEWGRIPHFYYNYYVYQYATGFSAATMFADKVLSGEEGAREKYLTFLKSGRSKSPIDILKEAGVDMTSNEPVRRTIDTFRRYLAELKSL